MSMVMSMVTVISIRITVVISEWVVGNSGFSIGRALSVVVQVSQVIQSAVAVISIISMGVSKRAGSLGRAADVGSSVTRVSGKGRVGLSLSLGLSLAMVMEVSQVIQSVGTVISVISMGVSERAGSLRRAADIGSSVTRVSGKGRVGLSLGLSFAMVMEVSQVIQSMGTVISMISMVVSKCAGSLWRAADVGSSVTRVSCQGRVGLSLC